MIVSPVSDEIDRIIGALLDPGLAFGDIAAMHGTTIDALSAFFARPEMQEGLEDLESAIAENARVAASHYLASVADAPINFL